MIIRMSKVEIAGPRELLLPALETIERLGVLQIDAAIKERVDEEAEHRSVRSRSTAGRWQNACSSKT